MLLEKSPELERAIKILDQTSCAELHKLGVLFVGAGQLTEPDALRNQNGSPLALSPGSLRYWRWLQRMGTLRPLASADFYTGGLDPRQDGQWAMVWADAVTQVVYHVATLMPGSEDPTCVNKKRHLGNNFVNIVWSEEEQFRPPPLGNVNHTTITITPLPDRLCRVSVPPVLTDRSRSARKSTCTLAR